jgi:hypothetical protein
MTYVSHFSYGLLFTFQVSNPIWRKIKHVRGFNWHDHGGWPLKSLQRLVKRNTSSSPPSCELSSWELARVFLTTYKHCSMANALHRIHASQTKHSKFSSYNTATGNLSVNHMSICKEAMIWYVDSTNIIHQAWVSCKKGSSWRGKDVSEHYYCWGHFKCWNAKFMCAKRDWHVTWISTIW